jgi:phenylacetate 2-hydroxylase
MFALLTLLAAAEVKSICLTMVSAGLDTVPGNLIMGIAYLASEDGQRIQQKAYDEIMKVYPNGDAWEKCLVEEKVPYVTALVKETLRYWTVIPICLPRESTKDIVYNGATIPAGTIFFMVATDPIQPNTDGIERIRRRLRRRSLQDARQVHS